MTRSQSTWMVWLLAAGLLAGLVVSGCQELRKPQPNPPPPGAHPEPEVDDVVFGIPDEAPEPEGAMPALAMEMPKPKALRIVPESRPPVDREQYELLDENPFKLASDDPLSTFSIDVDTAGYANVRRMIRQGKRPPVDAVRVEEMINYFRYSYPEPDGARPFSVSAEVAGCPWRQEHRQVSIGR